MRAELDMPRAAPFQIADLELEHVRDPEHRDLLGKTAGEIAAERGADALDVFLDLSIAEDLATAWKTRMTDVARQFIEHVVGESISEPLVMAGSSDGGAHLASFVGADYTTMLLTEWVPERLSLEQAVWRLAGMPAAVHGLVDRGTLRVGAKADLNVIDLERLRAHPHTIACDFPAQTERYTVDADGYEMVVVNGVPAMEKGKPTGATPGEILHGA